MLSEPRIEELLDTWPVARLGTIAKDGAPRLVPCVFARCAGSLWTPIDGKPKARAEPARVADLRRDPRATLLLDDYAEDWSRLWWIRVDADGDLHEPASEASDARFAAAADALRAKYPQYATTPLFRERPLLVELRPRRVSSWSAAPR